MKASTLDKIMFRIQDAIRIDFGKDVAFTGSIDRSINTGKVPKFKVYLNGSRIESTFMNSITGNWYFSNAIEIDRAACETIRHYKTLYRVNRDAKFNIKTSALKESYDKRDAEVAKLNETIVEPCFEDVVDKAVLLEPDINAIEDVDIEEIHEVVDDEHPF